MQMPMISISPLFFQPSYSYYHLGEAGSQNERGSLHRICSVWHYQYCRERCKNPSLNRVTRNHTTFPIQKPDVVCSDKGIQRTTCSCSASTSYGRSKTRDKSYIIDVVHANLDNRTN